MTKLSLHQANEVIEEDQRRVELKEFIRSLDEPLFAFLAARLLTDTDEAAIKKLKRPDITISTVGQWKIKFPLDEMIGIFRADALVATSELSKQYLAKSVIVLGDLLDSSHEQTRIKSCKMLLEMNELLGDNKISLVQTNVFLDNMKRARALLTTHKDYGDVVEGEIEED